MFFLLVSVEGKLLAEEKTVTGKFVVSFSAEDDQKHWVVNALEQNVYNDLSGYARVVPFKKVIEEEKKCKDRKVQCIIEVYNKLNVDALMLGAVDNSDIEFEVYDIQKKSLVNTGSIEIGSGASLLKLRLGAFKAFKAFIAKGGILEKRQYNSLVDNELTATNNQVNRKNLNSELRNQILIFLAGFTCFPYLLSFIGKPIRHPERSSIVLEWFFPFMIAASLIIAYQFILEATGSGNIYDNISSLFAGYQWILAGCGGILWGYFLIIHFKIVIPHLQGIERIKPNILFPLLYSCFLTIIIKTLIVATFYACFFYGVFTIGKLFSISEDVIITILFPFFGLYIFYWLALMLDVFSMSLDVKLSGRELDYNNVWNVKVKKYFIGYLKRNGVTLNKRLVDDIVFLPGENKGIVCYGGGFSRPRIVIEKDLIKFALGEIDDFNPEETVIFSRKVFEPVKRQNSVYKIVANLSPKNTNKIRFKARYDKKRIRYLEKMQKFFQRDLNSQGIKLNIRKENTMQGIVFPRVVKDVDFPSLMSDNDDDMRIIQELLLKNSSDNGRYDQDAEIDDSSEQDKDFLFGAVLHKFGDLLRHEDIFSTIYLYFRYKKGTKKKPYNFFFSKYFANIADTFVVLNFGLNHLMQHLYYQATNNSSHLTTKGVTSRMLKSQDEILISAKKATDERKPKIIQTDELERVVWLSRFCQDSIDIETNVRAKRLFKWSFTLAMTYLASLVIMNSYNYHPIYLEIIEKEKQEIAEAIKNAQEKERTEK